MNQWLADVFLALPQGLTVPRVFGSILLGLCWLGYLFWVRSPLTRAVQSRVADDESLAHPWRRVLYGKVRAKARLDEGGLYVTNLASLLGLLTISGMHALLFWLDADGVAVAGLADRAVLSVAAFAIGALCLLTQPAATLARRERWGFSRRNAVVHAVLWECVILIAMLLWMYDAWFLPVFA